MKACLVALLGVIMFAFAGSSRAQDENAKNSIVAKWELTKAGSELPLGSVIEFTKDKKLSIVLKDAIGDFKLQGTYNTEKDKLTVKVSINSDMIEESLTIKRLTDETLEIEDSAKKVNVFKKKK